MCTEYNCRPPGGLRNFHPQIAGAPLLASSYLDTYWCLFMSLCPHGPSVIQRCYYFHFLTEYKERNKGTITAQGLPFGDPPAPPVGSCLILTGDSPSISSLVWRSSTKKAIFSSTQKEKRERNGANRNDVGASWSVTVDWLRYVPRPH